MYIIFKLAVTSMLNEDTNTVTICKKIEKLNFSFK